MRLFGIILYSFLVLLCSFSDQVVKDIDWENNTVKINKDLEFFWDRYLSVGEEPPKVSAIVDIPFDWSKNSLYSVWGKGTFRTKIYLDSGINGLAIKMPYNLDSYKLYINGELLISNYYGGDERRYSTKVVKIPNTPILDIILQVANTHDNHGGLASPPVIGLESVLLRDLNRGIIFDAFLFGALILTGLLYCSFYFSKRDEKSSLFFGLFAIVLGIRTTLYGEHTLLMIIPNLSLELEATLGHLTYYFAVPLFMTFIAVNFPFRRSKVVLFSVYFVSGVYSIFAIIFPHKILIELLLYYQIFTLIFAAIATFILVRRALQGNFKAIATLLGFSVLLVTTINDILLAQEVINTIHLTPSGMMFFIITQGVLLSQNLAKTLHRSERLSEKLTALNKSFKRFVPEEFLNILDKPEVIDIRLGDHVQLNMTIMFLDIRDFTSLSERMTPRENFLFINSFLERIGPVIRTNGGFIDKYMGDGIMSLFPSGADTAVKAAMDIFKTLDIYNSHRSKSGYEGIKLGIGINTGSLMLGTIGENERMDGTVISDAVNICSRIESITKEYGLNIAISEDTYSNIFMKKGLFIRYIGKINLKGKKKPVAVYELFNMDNDKSIRSKIEFREEFEEGVELFQKEKYNEAKGMFSKILERCPDDFPCISYLHKIEENIYIPRETIKD
ncbi:adenylate/guanylate cyclase domain-containing protein [Thiospirochaeta perfilievii]|uniref:Adenylate/guanylate cyclase domain-containing protein n=1 Tax=Thiospirochaeta perfilievii TaxID=252967 RepID=A0A5C1QEJ4_9SPIO|nr:adenylate/guanylate cyclase domain-containing protein [Thiospirochaeta perfilievii]QEN04642.1 adenylate/guanylate cyclase domain-containing protein [Thiospirochaeta perfilievii]